MRPPFRQLQPLGRGRLQPSRKLKGHKLAKKAADARARVVIPAPTNRVFFRFIISTIWTVQGQFDEAGKGNYPLLRYLMCYLFGYLAQVLVVWCGFSY